MIPSSDEGGVVLRRPWIVLLTVGFVAAVVVPAAAVPPTSSGDAPEVGTIVRTPADDDGPAVTRYFGATRADTAALLARDVFADADTVVLARQDNFPDSLGGGFVAGAFDAPVLLTASTVLSDEVQLAVDEIAPERVIILGGLAAVSQDVEDDLSDQGIRVERLAGESRYDTGARIATAPGTSVGLLDGERTAIVASGTNFPDALVMSALSYANGFPLLLTDPSTLVPQTSTTLLGLGIERVLLAGGEGAVSPAVAGTIEDLGIRVTRLAGQTRVDTAVVIAAFAAREELVVPGAVNLAFGRNFPDALALGPAAGADPSPVLLTDGVDDLGGAAVTSYLGGLECVDRVVVGGGTAAVSDAVVAQARAQVADLAACAPPPPQPPPSCEDDVNEQDDTADASTPTEDGVALAGVSCPGDDDWLAVAARSGGSTEFLLSHAVSDGDLDVEFYDDSGELVQAYTTKTDDESGSFDVTLDDRPSVARIVNTGETRVPYEFTVTHTGPTCPDDDIFEPNDEADDATFLFTPARLTLALCTGTLNDEFTFGARAGELIRIRIESSNIPGTLLLDTDGEIVDFPTFVPNDPPPGAGSRYAYLVPPGEGGLHRLSVALTSEDMTYTLDVDVLDPTCAADDAFEDNDGPFEAAPLASGTEVDGLLCAQDPIDVFGVAAAPGETVLLGGLTTVGDVESRVGPLNFFNFTYRPRSYTRQDEDPSDVPVTLFGLDFAPASYTTSVVVGAMDCPDDDGFEPNDARSLAADLVPGFHDAHLCESPDANDWYAFEAVAGDEIRVRVDADGPKFLNQPLFYGVDPSGADVDLFDGYAVTTTGTHWLRVSWALGDPAFDHVLHLQTDPDVDCASDDVFEPNDGFAVPFDVGPGTYAGTTCTDDRRDHFVVHAEAGQTVAALLEFTHATANLNLRLFDRRGNQIDQSTTTTDDEDVSAVVAESGFYTLQVDNIGLASNDYDLTIEVTDP